MELNCTFGTRHNLGVPTKIFWHPHDIYTYHQLEFWQKVIYHISLITPSKLRDILSNIKTAIRKTNPDYDLVIDRLHLYYNMQLVTFGIDKDQNCIVQFPVFIQPYTQQPPLLYQIETVSVPIIDQNTEAQSYTHLQVNKLYIALNSET